MSPNRPPAAAPEQTVRLRAGPAVLTGDLAVPDDAGGVVLFAHGSGRLSPRNRLVASRLRDAGLGTLLLDLLTEDEEAEDRYSAHLRFDIDRLADRLVAATDWLAAQPLTRARPVGYFGASTGGGAALVAATRRPHLVRAVVSRGGRPDLAGGALPEVRAATLLVVGGLDDAVLGLNRKALAALGAAVKELVVVPGASHLFEEPGKLEEVARLAADWFTRHLRPAG